MREGVAASKVLLAGLRMALVLLAMFMLRGRAVGRADGLPYLTILVDDSASGRIADQYEKPEVKTALERRCAGQDRQAGASGRKQTTRLASPRA